jgi:hypothetical protein
MRLGHTCDDCRHIEFHLPLVGVFPGDWWAACALNTADRHHESERTDESRRNDPLK